MKINLQKCFNSLISLSILFDFVLLQEFQESSKQNKAITLNIKRSYYDNDLISDENLSQSNLRNLDRNTIFGNSSSLNYYYVDIYLGEPPQKQAVILDTGSPLLTVPCMPLCTNCGKHINSYYDMSKSNESSTLSCKTDTCNLMSKRCDKDNFCSFNMTFAEQSSLSGVIIEDKFRLGDSFHNFKPVKIALGCTKFENKLFYDQEVDGIMGLGRSDGGLVNSLYKLKVIDRNIFSLCLAQNGGYFSLGGVNTTLHLEDIKYIPTYRNGYLLKINEIRVNDVFITTSQNTYGLMDSGSTVSYLPEDLYYKVNNATSEFCSKPYRCLGSPMTTVAGVCLTLFENINTLQFLESMPTFIFTFEGDVKFFLKPENYIFNYTAFSNKKSNNLTLCYGIVKSKGMLIFGSTFWHNHDVIFDNENNRIGFAETNCANDDFYKKTEQVFIEVDKEKNAIFFIVLLFLFMVIMILFIGFNKLLNNESFLWMTVRTESNRDRESTVHHIESNIMSRLPQTEREGNPIIRNTEIQAKVENI